MTTAFPALDPDAARLRQLAQEAGYPPFEALTPAQARRAYLAASPALQSPGGEVAALYDLAIDGPGGPLPLRVYHGAPPMSGERLGAMLFLHGGGWTLGNLETHDALCRQVARRAGVVVVAVDYRLAPEHPFPAALEDAACALRWLHANAGTLGVAPEAIAVAGDSAGGNLAAALALMARDGDVPRLACQVMAYPALNLGAESAAYRRVDADALLTATTMRWFIEQYAPDPAQRLDWRASPLQAASLRGVAPAVVLTVAHDPLCDEGLEYARRLDQDGVRVAALHLNDQFHGLLGLGRFVPSADLVTGFLADLLGHELRRACARAPT